MYHGPVTGDAAGPTLPTVALVYGVASALSLAAFAWDKAAAVRGGARVPERVLHGIEFLGGWPGAILGAILFRHKTRKVSYLVVTAAAAVLHLAAWWWWLRRP